MQDHFDILADLQKDELPESISRRTLLKMGFSSAMATMLLMSAEAMTVAGIITSISGCGSDSNNPAPSPESASAQPAAPTGVSITPGNSKATIAWTAVSGATSYNCYWSTTPDVSTANGIKYTDITNPYTMTGLSNGITYYCIVTAVNSYGESSASTQVSATPAASGAVPSAPTGVSATPGIGKATIAWTAVSGATSYNCYWSTTPGVTTANGTKIIGIANPYTLTGLTNGITYYCIVTAVNSNGESSASTQVSATPAASTYSNYSNTYSNYSNTYYNYYNTVSYYNYFVNSW